MIIYFRKIENPQQAVRVMTVRVQAVRRRIRKTINSLWRRRIEQFDFKVIFPNLKLYYFFSITLHIILDQLLYFIRSAKWLR